MIHFNIAGSVVDDLTTDLRGLSDIKIVRISGQYVLVVASEADSAITSFVLNESGVPEQRDSQAFNSSSGTGRIWALNFAQISGEMVLLPATRYEDQTAFFALGGNGSLSGPSFGAESGIFGEGIGLNETVVIGTNTYVFVQSYGGQTLTAYVLGNNQRLSKLQELQDNDASFLEDISALSHWRIGTNTFLFVASAFDAGVTVYRVGNDGRLAMQDTVEPEDGSGFAKVQDLASFEVEGQAFVVMASAGSSSLTVYRVANNGNLSEVDHMIDTLDTRFQNASSVEAFSFEGRQFLVAAGSDDGITVLEVLSGGILRVEASLADTYGITLNNVSGVAVEIIGGIPVLYVSSSSDHGFTRIELDIVPPPQTIKGTPLADNLVGTDEDDRIEGRAGDDTLNGGAGADVLLDGRGEDQLHGSHGADVFAFVQDGKTDYVTDFNPDWDIIDFTLFSDISSFVDLRIVKGCQGVMIYAGGEFLVLETERHSLEIEDLSAAHFIF